jgi:hypothetical protein
MMYNSGANAASKQYAHAFAANDMDEDDFPDQDYGDYYDEEDESMNDPMYQQAVMQQQQRAG